MLNSNKYEFYLAGEAEVASMLKSMTGFGAGEYCGEGYKLHIEIKSVNHRYREMNLHLPKVLCVFEDELRKLAAAILSRGKIDVFVSLDEHIQRGKKISVDRGLLIAYFDALKEIGRTLEISSDVSAHQMMQYPDVLSFEEEMLDVELFRDALLKTMDEALGRIAAMRLAEGRHLYDDLSARINILDNYADDIEKRSPKVAAQYHARLLGKIKEAFGDIAYDESRVLQEVLLFSDKANITEEIVRLKSHLKQFKTTAESRVCVGRKLDFIVQEMNREVNTIAAKANDAQITSLVVEMKGEIEKIREQVQNIE